MKRVAVAVLGVVALVAAAFGLRALRAGDDTSGADDPAEVAPQVLVCAPEMAEACTELADAAVQVRVEAPGVTLARVRDGGGLDGDAWLAPRPWIDLTRDAARAAGRADPFGAVSDTLARSDLVLIVRSDRRAALETACGVRIDWACVAQRAGTAWGGVGGSDAWGTIRLGLDDPVTTTAGRLALAQMARAFAHRDTIDARDLEAVRSALAAVATHVTVAAGADRTALDTMLDAGDSFDLVVALEAVTRVAIASPKASGQLELVELPPATGADAVLATATTTASGRALPVDHERVRRALTSTGWHFADKSPSGTPDAATLDALLALWRAVATTGS